MVNHTTGTDTYSWEIKESYIYGSDATRDGIMHPLSPPRFHRKLNISDDQHSQEKTRALIYAIILDWYFNSTGNKTFAMHVKREYILSSSLTAQR